MPTKRSIPTQSPLLFSRSVSPISLAATPFPLSSPKQTLTECSRYPRTLAGEKELFKSGRGACDEVSSGLPVEIGKEPGVRVYLRHGLEKSRFVISDTIKPPET
jgi:hypothetical protein